MNSVEILEELLLTARFITNRYLEDLSFEEICLPPGVGANPIVWQLGHLIVSEVEMIERLSTKDTVILPTLFLDLHQKQPIVVPTATTDPVSPLRSDTWHEWLRTICNSYTKETYLSLLTESRAISIKVLRGLSTEELLRSAPAQMAQYAKTWASVFVMIGIHETQHAGQLAVLRRILGKRVVI